MSCDRNSGMVIHHSKPLLSRIEHSPWPRHRNRRNVLRPFRLLPRSDGAIGFSSLMGWNLSIPWLSIHLGRLVTLLSLCAPIGSFIAQQRDSGADSSSNGCYSRVTDYKLP
jgi:hypothetical protein